ncbi:hypothetical protein KPG71_01445 [Roseovarius sp. PS-C2]|uniref:hypothetical protein n=1 Tax=Roseovarius sp. PS-C2 TaxID=2820814 RepID=UPI001C0B904E|nr:hypothetical protein [Roseovarius sp. PS-C2]MBU3258671.1 hypothetical protein [Roseovarius sp. PS-C2]
MPDTEPPADWLVRLRRIRRKVQIWTGRNLPPGVRLLAGLVLMAGGVLGFLPVVGFWMFPLGMAVAALDVVPVWRWLRGRRKGGTPPRE